MKYLLIALMLLFSSCSMKNYEYTQSKLVTIKTAKLKFSDIGYVRHSNNAVELEMFVAGNSVFKISIDNFVCTSDGCISKSKFNEEYLHVAYPDNLFQNVILGKKIYDGKSLTRNGFGFEQNIETQDVNIEYKVDTKQIYFKDKQNNILIKIKELNHG